MMSPDCRTDDRYNFDFLDERDHEFTRGFDWATEAVDNLFDNIDSLTDGSDHIENFLDEELPEHMQVEYTMDFMFSDDAMSEERKCSTYGDFLRFQILSWLEKSRNELITSMIDSMDEDVYKAIRNKVLKDNEASENPKEYYDTRKFIFTGKKEADGIDED